MGDREVDDALARSFLVGGPVNVGVQTVEPSSLFRISSRALTVAARRDSRVSWAIAEFLTRRLYENLEQTAVNAFGSVRQRVAAQAGAGRCGRDGPRGGGPGAARAADHGDHRDRSGPHRDPGCDPAVRRIPRNCGGCDFSRLDRNSGHRHTCRLAAAWDAEGLRRPGGGQQRNEVEP